MAERLVPMPAHLNAVTPGAVVMAGVAWWLAPHPWSLILPIVILLGLSFYALHVTQRRNA
jgi:hypothetical protein